MSDNNQMEPHEHIETGEWYCWDCGVEMTVTDVEKQVKNNGFFSGKCPTCLWENGTD